MNADQPRIWTSEKTRALMIAVIKVSIIQEWFRFNACCMHANTLRKAINIRSHVYNTVNVWTSTSTMGVLFQCINRLDGSDFHRRWPVFSVTVWQLRAAFRHHDMVQQFFFLYISMIHPSPYIDNTARFLLPSQAAWTLLYLSNLQRGCIYTWIRCSHWSYLFPSWLIKTLIYNGFFFPHVRWVGHCVVCGRWTHQTRP